MSIDSYKCRSTLISVDHITVEVKKKEVLLMALTSHRTNRRSRKQLSMTPPLTIKRKLHCRSAKRRGKINQLQCSIPGLAIGWFFRFCFRPRQPSFHRIISDGVVNGIGRNGSILILPTPTPSQVKNSLKYNCTQLQYGKF